MNNQTSLGLFTVTAGVAAALVALLLFAGQIFISSDNGGSQQVASTVTASPSPEVLTEGSEEDDDGYPTAGNWLLAASGFMIVAGGAWAVNRARREI